MCPFTSGLGDMTASVICYSVKVFLLTWIIFVPIAITSRLEKIIKLLQDEGKSLNFCVSSPMI